MTARRAIKEFGDHRKVVYALLEMDPKKFIMRAKTKPLDDITRTFQQQALAFIKWKERGGEGLAETPNDLVAIKKARDFEEIQTILAKYDDGTFMVFVQEYC